MSPRQVRQLGRYPRAIQRGAVLPLALLFTLLLGLVAAAGLDSAALQLRMAGNDQLHEELWYKAGSVAARLAGERGNFILASGAGHTNCAGTDPWGQCDITGLPEAAEFALGPGVAPRYRVVRQDSVSAPAGAASFEVDVLVAADAGRGRSAEVVLGVAVPLAGGNPTPLYWREPGIDPL